MIGYTNYPIQGICGIHQVAILTYDRNKYALVRSMDGTLEEKVKLGYIWRDSDMSRRFPYTLWHQLPYEEGGKIFTKLQAHRAVMSERRKKKTTYEIFPVDRNENVKKYNNLQDALRCFAKITSDGSLRVTKHRKLSWSAELLLDIEGDSVIPYTNRRGGSVLKTRHIKMLNTFRK